MTGRKFDGKRITIETYPEASWAQFVLPVAAGRGLMLRQCSAGGPTRIANAKIGLIKFCLSKESTDMDSNVVIKDYAAMDRMFRTEELYLAKMVKDIAKTGCNVLLIQKSILRDATTDLSLGFCAKAKIMVVTDVDSDRMDFIAGKLGVEPSSSLDSFNESKLGHAELVVEESLGGDMGSFIRFSGLKVKPHLRPAELEPGSPGGISPKRVKAAAHKVQKNLGGTIEDSEPAEGQVEEEGNETAKQDTLS